MIGVAEDVDFLYSLRYELGYDLWQVFGKKRLAVQVQKDFFNGYVYLPLQLPELGLCQDVGWTMMFWVAAMWTTFAGEGAAVGEFDGEGVGQI